jgi:dolichol-phosphate mannosyltransferase
VEPLRSALEVAGYDAEILICGPLDLTGSDAAHHSWTWVAVPDNGRAACAVAGLERARGDFRIALDPARTYGPEDLLRVVRALEDGRGALVIGSRFEDSEGSTPVSLPGRALGRLARLVTGTSDPLSGLVGLTEEALDRSTAAFMAVGSQFALELLAKVDSPRVDVAARPGPPARREWPGFDELRHIKRLADHRFGNFSRLFQFCAVGASGMVVDLTFYAAFQWIFARGPLHRVVPGLGPLDLAVAGFLAVALALCWNFSLNRRLTFSYARHGSLTRQFFGYLASNAAAISLNLTLRLSLPAYVGFFNRHRLAAALVGIVLATGISFSMSRWVVFRHRGVAPSRSPNRSSLICADPATAEIA